MQSRTLIRALHRAGHMNTLLFNVDLSIDVREDKHGQLVWIIRMYDCGSYIGDYYFYRHERSAVRAAWRLYRIKEKLA